MRMSTPIRVRSVAMKQPGFCSPQKFQAMYDLVRQVKPGVLVEIGVFGGRSLLAFASGCRANQYGRTWGIDPYAAAESLVGYEGGDAVAAGAPPIMDLKYWGALDYDSVHAGCLRAIEQLGLADYCRVLRETSRSAAARFSEIDVMHIDGNHTEAAALGDVQLYAPKVRSGGYIFFDDVDWESTHKALDLLQETFSEVTNNGSYALYRKR